MKRVTLIVTDSLGVGALPDAADYGDAGADTFGHIVDVMNNQEGGINIPNLQPDRRIRQIYGAFKGQGHHYGTLGDCRS